MDRRGFVRNLGFLAAAGGIGSLLQSCNDELLPLTIPSRSFRILELDLRIRQKSLEQTRIFWRDFMGFTETYISMNRYQYQVGNARLKTRTSNLPPSEEDFFFPQYHFSISIPPNQIENCLNWFYERARQEEFKTLSFNVWKDSVTGAEIVRRELYNSQSIFIEDPAGNIIEILSRHNPDNPDDLVEGDFSPAMFRGITEVGCVCNDVRKVTNTLKETFQVDEVDRTSNSYKPIGGPDGLLKLTVPGKIWFPTADERAVSHDLIITVKHTEVIAPIKLSLYGDQNAFETGVWLKTEV